MKVIKIKKDQSQTNLLKNKLIIVVVFIFNTIYKQSMNNNNI